MLAGIRASIEDITGEWRSVAELSGGSIASVYRLNAAHGTFAVKYHVAAPQGLFASEASCLRTLRSVGAEVPEVMRADDDYLLMRFVAPGDRDLAAAGNAVARLHGVGYPKCGFQHDTYLATFLQPNTLTDSWADFFFGQRLVPMLHRLQLADNEMNQWQNFAERAKPLLATVEQFSLLHGDLWPGNLLFGESGPVFIDPACYYGDPLVDIAMWQLFGGTGGLFDKSYFSMTADRAFRDTLLQIYQIYPLLTHAVLFGGNYYFEACQKRDAFVAHS